MNYHPDDFLNLLDAIERSGGKNLPDPCLPTEYRLKQPDPATGELRWRDLFTIGCEQRSRFDIPPMVGAELQEHSDRAFSIMSSSGADIDFSSEPTPTGPYVVCAVDDDIGKWPRFQGAVQ